MGVSGSRTEGETAGRTLRQSREMGVRRKIQAVTFDVGHTLIEPHLSVGEVYAEVAARHGHANLSPAELQRRFEAALPPRGGAVDTRAEWAEIGDATFGDLVTPPPSKTFFPELFERFGQ